MLNQSNIASENQSFSSALVAAFFCMLFWVGCFECSASGEGTGAGAAGASAAAESESSESNSNSADSGFVSAREKANAMAEHVNRGNSLMRARQYQAALAEYEAAKRVDPKSSNLHIVTRNIAECYNNMGISLYRQKAYPEAIAQFEKCLALCPQHGQARRNINLCRQVMDMEGIADLPPPEEEAADGKSGKGGQESDKNKKEDGSPKVVGAAPGGSGLSSNASVYVSGSQMFPVYSNQPTASSVKVLPTNPEEKKIAVKSANNPLPLAVVPPDPQSDPQSSSSSQSKKEAAERANKSIEQAGSGLAGEAFNTPLQEPKGYEEARPTAGAVVSSQTPLSTQRNYESGSSNFTAPVQTSAPPVQTSAPPAQTSAPPAQTSAPSAQTAVPNNVATPSKVDALKPAAQSYQDGITLEDKVAALELKVYGKKSGQLPLMKRIEQLETDYIGSLRSGPMSERVENLRKAIGQN